MRTSLFVGLLVSIEIANAHPAETYDRGWRPMSKEEAFRRFRISMRKTPETWGPADKGVMALKEAHGTWGVVDPINDKKKGKDGAWGAVDSIDDKKAMTLKDDAMKVVEPLQVLSGFNGRDVSKFEKKGSKNKNDNQDRQGDIDCFEDNKSGKRFQSDSSTESYKPISTTTKYIRIAKKISEHTFQNIIEAPQFINKENAKYANEAESTTNYEVTESNDETQDLLKTDQNIILSKKSGYIYNTPKIPNVDSTTTNLSQKLTSILSKYIDKDVNDKNYIISREPKKRSLPIPEFIYLPVPLKAFHGYNSNNHVPVNPMLAVILSNYGYYLPGSYGHHNQYRNLYGYLASNNIHNNKPFGMYKVFSDTDISN